MLGLPRKKVDPILESFADTGCRRGTESAAGLTMPEPTDSQAGLTGRRFGQGLNKTTMVEVLQRYANTAQNHKSPISVYLKTPKSTEIVQHSVDQHIHKARQRLDPAIIDRLVADYRDGMPTTQLMQTYHLSKGAILRIMDAHGVPRRNTAMRPADQVTAIRLYRQGWSLARVGAHLNRDAGTIQHVLIRAGVPRRDSHGRERCG